MTTETKNETDAHNHKGNLNIVGTTKNEEFAWSSLERYLSALRSKNERRQIMLHEQMNDAFVKYRSQVDSVLKTLREEIARLTADLESVQKVARETTERNKELSEQNEALAAERENLKLQYYHLWAKQTIDNGIAAYKRGLAPTKRNNKLETDEMLNEKDNEIKRLEEKLQEAQQKPAALAKGVVDYAVERLSDIHATPNQQGYMTERNLIDLLITEVFCKHLPKDDINPLKLNVFNIAATRSKAERERQEEHTPVQHNDHCQQFFAPVDKPTFNHNKTPDQ